MARISKIPTMPHDRPRDPALLTINPAHAAIVLDLFERSTADGISLYVLAVDLTDRPVCSPSGRQLSYLNHQ